MVWNGTFRHPARFTDSDRPQFGPFFDTRFRISRLFQNPAPMSVSVQELGRLYLAQLTKGCKNEKCCNMDCARNRSPNGAPESPPSEEDKKAVVQRAITMAKCGTVFSCSYVNRAFASDESAEEMFVDPSILDDVTACEKIIRCVAFPTIDRVEF